MIKEELKSSKKKEKVRNMSKEIDEEIKMESNIRYLSVENPLSSLPCSMSDELKTSLTRPRLMVLSEDFPRDNLAMLAAVTSLGNNFY